VVKCAAPCPKVAGDTGQDSQLLATEAATGEADPQHLHIGQTPHAIDTLVQSKGSEVLLRDIALPALYNCFCQPVNLGGD